MMWMIVEGGGDGCICIKISCLVPGIAASHSLSVCSHWDGVAAVLLKLCA